MVAPSVVSCGPIEPVEVVVEPSLVALVVDASAVGAVLVVVGVVLVVGSSVVGVAPVESLVGVSLVLIVDVAPSGLQAATRRASRDARDQGWPEDIGDSMGSGRRDRSVVDVCFDH